MATPKRIYRVRFMNEGKLVELFAREVTQGGLFGFVEIGKLVWGRKSEVIIDPSEQDLRNEFGEVQRIHVPIHAVVRIDEVEKSGPGKIVPLPGGGGERAAVAGFPIYTPSGPKPAK